MQAGQQGDLLTYIDLFRYKSLRRITIPSMILFLSSSILFYMPFYLVTQFGFNFYFNGLIINLSELISFPFCLYSVRTLKRRGFVCMCLVVALLASFILVFIDKNRICTQNCWNVRMVGELGLFIILRFFICMEFQIIYVYIFELYPSQVAVMSFSIESLMVNLSNAFLPELISSMNGVNFPVMILGCLASGVGMLALIPLRETYGELPREKVEELDQKGFEA